MEVHPRQTQALSAHIMDCLNLLTHSTSRKSRPCIGLFALHHLLCVMPHMQLCACHRVGRDGRGWEEGSEDPLHRSHPHGKSKWDDVGQTCHMQEHEVTIDAQVLPGWTPRVSWVRLALVIARRLPAACFCICVTHLNQCPHYAIVEAQCCVLQKSVGQFRPHFTQHFDHHWHLTLVPVLRLPLRVQSNVSQQQQ